MCAVHYHFTILRGKSSQAREEQWLCLVPFTRGSHVARAVQVTACVGAYVAETSTRRRSGKAGVAVGSQYELRIEGLESQNHRVLSLQHAL